MFMSQRPARHRDARGFTLIELLTVIAIIAILAGLTFGVLPRVLERAKRASLTSALNQIRNGMVTYMTDHGSFPPAYGFRAPWTRGMDQPGVIAAFSNMVQQSNGQLSPDDLERMTYHLEPWDVHLNLHGTEDVLDTFSQGYDTDGDSQLGLLEFHPLGSKDVATGALAFPTVRYNTRNLSDEVQRQLAETERPIIYIPFNVRQFKLAKRFWIENGHFNANVWDPSITTFPPPTYDAFVLLSGGPSARTYGLLPEGPAPGEVDPLDTYHVAALRAAFMATRDLNNNDVLDFDFIAREQGEGSVGDYEVRAGGKTFTANNNLPDPEMPAGQGPWIYVYGLN